MLSGQLASGIASGSLPYGRGEVGINLWVEDGGDLFFVISRSDTFSGSPASKVGGGSVSPFTPNPFTTRSMRSSGTYGFAMASVRSRQWTAETGWIPERCS